MEKFDFHAVTTVRGEEICWRELGALHLVSSGRPGRPGGKKVAGPRGLLLAVWRVVRFFEGSAAGGGGWIGADGEPAVMAVHVEQSPETWFMLGVRVRSLRAPVRRREIEYEDDFGYDGSARSLGLCLSCLKSVCQSASKISSTD